MSIIAVMALPSDVYEGSLTPGRLAAKYDSPQKLNAGKFSRFQPARDRRGKFHCWLIATDGTWSGQRNM
jgi:hypothetical protein